MSNIKLNKSVSRAIDLLELLSEASEPLTLLQIERELDIPKSSTFELVYTLVEKGVIEQLDKKFAIGVKASRIGISYSNKSDILQAGKRILDDLAKRCGETIFLAKYLNDQVFYIYKNDNYTDLSATCPVGTVKGLYYTALGKAILSTQSKEEVLSYFTRTEIVKYTDNTIITPQKMLAEMEMFRKQGYAVEDKEGSENMYCVACPIFGNNNKVVAALSITTPHYKMDIEKSREFGKLANKACLEISQRLGFFGNSLY